MWPIIELNLRLHFSQKSSILSNDISHHLNFTVSKYMPRHVEFQYSLAISFTYALMPNQGSKFFKDKVYAFHFSIPQTVMYSEQTIRQA